MVPLRILGRGRTLGLILITASGLAGCSWLPDFANPIEWYRGVTGVNKNDDQGGDRNAQNLAAGNKEPYPNLGSVPPPPDRATSGVDRKKLEEGLVADRANAKYSSDELSAGRSIAVPSTTPTQPVAVPATPSTTATPTAQTPSTSPATTPTTPPPTAAATSSAPSTPEGTAPSTPSATRRTALGGGSHRPPQQGSEEPPAESPLTAPSVRSEPQGETPHAEPPSPGLQPQHAPAAPLPPRLAATTPPRPPELAASQPPATGPLRRPNAPSVSTQVAEVAFSAGSTTLSPDATPHLSEVVKLYQQHSTGAVRVVSYGKRGVGPDAAQQELTSFSQALDRANAIAQALARLGVPANKINVEAAPASAASAAKGDQADIFLEY